MENERISPTNSEGWKIKKRTLQGIGVAFIGPALSIAGGIMAFTADNGTSNVDNGYTQSQHFNSDNNKGNKPDTQYLIGATLLFAGGLSSPFLIQKGESIGIEPDIK